MDSYSKFSSSETDLVLQTIDPEVIDRQDKHDCVNRAPEVTKEKYEDIVNALHSNRVTILDYPKELFDDIVNLALHGYCAEREISYARGLEDEEFVSYATDLLCGFMRIEHACLFRNAYASKVLLKDDILHFFDDNYTEAQFYPSPDRINSAFWRFLYSTLNTLSGITTDCCDGFWALAKKAFQVALGSHYDVLVRAASWVEDIWKRTKEWCETIIKESAQWLAGFQECVNFAVGVVGVACVIVLLEKFMIGIGLLKNPINMGTGFLLVVLGYMGIKEGGLKFGSTVGSMLVRLVGACQSIVETVQRMFASDGTEGKAQMNPIDLLEVFAKSLGCITSDTLVSTGRVFGAVTQISKGCETIWVCVSKVCEFLWDLLDKGFGIKSRALSDISVLVGCDIQKWLKKCDAACEYMNWNPAVSQEILAKFRTLKYQGTQIRDTLLSKGTRGTNMVVSTISRALERLQDLLDAAILAGQAGPRKEPFWVAFYGEAGVGKSTAVNHLCAKYLWEKNLDSSDVYPRNTADDYWSNYRRQTVVTYDDLGALSTEQRREEVELIKLVSRDALPLVMARIEEKGMYFDSSLILSSSNFVSFNPHAAIHEPQAYWRRRNMLVQVVWRGTDRTMNPSDPVGHQSYILRRNCEPFEELQRFETFEDLFAYFLSRMVEHEKKENELMRTLVVPAQTLNGQINALGQLVTFLKGAVPPGVQKILDARYKGWVYLTCVDSSVVLWNIHMDTHFVDVGEFDAEDIAFLKKDSLRISLNYRNVLRTFPDLNPMADHYMTELVDGDVFTKELTVVKELQAKDIDLFEVANEIPLWQRALIRSMSNVCAENGQNFFSGLYTTLCKQIQTRHIMDVRKWPTCVKLGLGLLVFFVFGKFVFRQLSFLANFGSATSMSLAAASLFTFGQSEDGMQKDFPETDRKMRNMSIRTRHFNSQKINPRVYESYGQNEGADYSFLMRNCLASIAVGTLEGQILLLPGRRLVGVIHMLKKIPDKSLVKISTESQDYFVVWHADCFRWLEGSELGVYSHSAIREVAKSIEKRIHYGIETLPDVFPVKFCCCKLNESGEYIPEVADITVEKRKKLITVWAGEYQREIPTCLEYKAATIDKDCGSLLIAKIGKIDKIVGVHVAGLQGLGQACFLPCELEMAEGQNFVEEDVNVFPEPEFFGNSLKKIGIIAKEKRFFMPAKTTFVQTPNEWHLDTPCDKIPSILRKGDVRLAGTDLADYDPYQVGMEKYALTCGPFDTRLLSMVGRDICEQWVDNSTGFSFDECTFKEAVTGIDGLDYFDPLVMTTSEGYPYVLERQNGEKGKHRYFVEDGETVKPTGLLEYRLKLLEEISLERVPDLVAIECAKDEKLPTRKVLEKPKTRLFSILPLDYNLLVRIKFLRFVRFIMKKRDVLSCQVGLNPYGREWGRVANRLLSIGNNILCCDYSRFDGILCPQIMEEIADMINTVSATSLCQSKQKKNLLMACCSRYGIADGKVWQVDSGIPSGFPLTVIINSIFNEMIVRYLYRKCFRHQPLIASSFDQYVALVTYGDDNLISVHATISSVFNGAYIQTEAAKLGITITDGVDKEKDLLEFRNLESCDFLKRKFVKDKYDRWRAPMELTSLWSQLHWVRVDHLELNEAFLVNVGSVLRELYIHSESRAKVVRAKCLALPWVKSTMLPTLDQLKAFHEVQLGSDVPSAGGTVHILQPAMLGPITHNAECVEDFEFKNLVATTNAAFVRTPFDFVVSLGPLKNVASDMKIVWEAGAGRGELPSHTWLARNFVGDNCEIYKKLKMAYDAGKRIVFVSRNSNVYASIFLMLFGWKSGILHPMESNLLLSHAMNTVKSLGYLATAFPQLVSSQVLNAHVTGNLRYYRKWCVFDFGDVPIVREKFRNKSANVTFQFQKMEPCQGINLQDTVEVRHTLLRKKATHGIFLCAQISVEGHDDVMVPLSCWYSCPEIFQNRNVVVKLFSCVYDDLDIDIFESVFTGKINHFLDIGVLQPSFDLVYDNIREHLNAEIKEDANTEMSKCQNDNAGDCVIHVGMVTGRIPPEVRAEMNLLLPYAVGKNRIWVDPAEIQYLRKSGMREKNLSCLYNRVMGGKISRALLRLLY